MRNNCKHCNGAGTKWSGWFKVRSICSKCGGDGFAKPPGWPDESLMRKLRPLPPTLPPRRL